MQTLGPRLLLQYLEPSPALDGADPTELRDHLGAALERLPVTDIAFGWDLRPELIEAVRPIVPIGVSVWRWVPVFVDSGSGRPADALVAVGPEGQAPLPFRDMADFRFLCLDEDEVASAGLQHATTLANEIDADGVLLDRIRWHSPSGSPASELTCFCATSQSAAAADGLDISSVAARLRALATTLDGRRALVAALLGRADSDVGDFLAWRARTVTRTVAGLARGLQDRGLRTALDVFTPALAASVGQDLGALAEHGAWAKSMTYLDALGPAAMPFELSRYVAWLGQAGDPDGAAFVSELIGYDAPLPMATGPHTDALRHEAGRLARAVGIERSIVGIDAVEIPAVCEVSDEDLAARVATVRDAGLGLSPCWELLLISDDRVGQIGAAWSGSS